MKRTPLSKFSPLPVSKLKRDIQKLVREIVIRRDKGCLLKGFRFECSTTLQAHHLISRGRNVGFADTRLIVCLCSGHHTAETYDDTGDYYEMIVSKISGERAILLGRTRKDTKSYPMSAWDWGKVILALKAELAAMPQ